MVDVNTLGKLLLQLGLSQKEANIFVETFELGPIGIEDIARAARVRRSTAYLLIKGLIEKGFLFEDLRKYGKLIYAIEPEKLLALISAKQRQFRRLELEVVESLPDLQSVYQASGNLPKVRVFEGKNGLLDVRKDILKRKQEVFLWTNQEAEKKFFSVDYHKAFIEERVEKQIPIKVLAVDNEMGQRLKKDDLGQFRKTKLLPKEVTFNAETYIYGNKVAILDYQKDIIGIIIESISVASAQKAFFGLTWDNIKV